MSAWRWWVSDGASTPSPHPVAPSSVTSFTRTFPVLSITPLDMGIGLRRVMVIGWISSFSMRMATSRPRTGSLHLS